MEDEVAALSEACNTDTSIITILYINNGILLSHLFRYSCRIHDLDLGVMGFSACYEAAEEKVEQSSCTPPLFVPGNVSMVEGPLNRKSNI